MGSIMDTLLSITAGVGDLISMEHMAKAGTGSKYMAKMSKHMACLPSIIGNTPLPGMATMASLISSSVKLLGTPVMEHSKTGKNLQVLATLGGTGQRPIGTR